MQNNLLDEYELGCAQRHADLLAEISQGIDETAVIRSVNDVGFNYGTVTSDSILSHSNRATCLIKHAASDRPPEHKSHKITFEMLIKINNMLPQAHSWEQYIKAARRIAL